MPAWWGKKSSSSKNKEDNSNSNNPSPRSVERDNRDKKGVVGVVNFTNSPRVSREIRSGSSGFSGFDSDSGEKKEGHPLPRPVVDHGVGGFVFGSGGSVSGSVSSVSSSGSYGEDHPERNDNHLGQVGGYRLHVDQMRHNMRSRSPGPGSRSPGPRSPGPASRVPSRPTSPLHPRLASISLDSPGGGSEEGKSQCHPLPLPPSSPTSPSSLTGTRNNGSAENVHSTLSKWKKGKLLGRGTFGHVYLGFNSESGQMCAIKEVRVVSDDQTSKECLKQLNQEINLLSQLSHPNIVRYYGSELSEETLSVYLEYVSGGSIHKLLQEYGAFGEPVIQNYTRQILSGLAYLHGRNTVHRDIKGANILVDPNGEIKLADFGMAKHITSCSSMLSFKGSPYWMAPEVVMNTNGYSLPVDIWSLGCTILEMSTSKPPWSQYEGVAAIFKIGNSKDMPYIPDHLSDEAKSFIKQCLQRDPAARPTAARLLEHPFVRDQATTRTTNISVTRDAFPYTFDGSRTPPASELHPNRTSITLGGPAGAMNVRAIRSPRDDVRMITSLPVSPCSSPLRQLGPAHKSCFLSPPHPSYPLIGQNVNRYNLSDYLVSPSRTTTYILDNFLEPSSLKGQIPGTSTRARLI